MKKMLLIVDDEKMVRDAMSLQFDPAEVEVLTVANGEDGLKIALQYHPDLILLDLVMPKMDGMTMLEQLRKDKWGKQAEVIILTNLSESEKIAKAMDCGTYEYLVKVDWNVLDVITKIKKKLGLK